MFKYFILLKDHEDVSTVNTNHSAHAAVLFYGSLRPSNCFELQVQRVSSATSFYVRLQSGNTGGAHPPLDLKEMNPQH